MPKLAMSNNLKKLLKSISLGNHLTILLQLIKFEAASFKSFSKIYLLHVFNAQICKEQ